MKYLFVLVVLCAAIGFSEQVLSREKINEMILKILTDCAGKEGGSADDIAYITARNAPSSTVQKCMSACVGETAGLIKDGKTDVEMSVKLAKNAFGADDPKVAAAQAIATECAAISDPDRCEAAAKMYECGKDAAVKQGYTFKDFM